MTTAIDDEWTANAAAAEADSEYPPEPPRLFDPVVRQQMYDRRAAFLDRWNWLTGADVRADKAWWKNLLGL